MDNARPLDRYLSQVDVWGMAFGCMVGWGVFAMPGSTFLPVAGPMGTLIALTIGMLIMLVVGSNFAYLAGRSTITGGVYSYTKEAFGRDHAFLSAWFLCLSYLTIVFLNGTALFLVVRILFSNSYPRGIHYTVAGNTIYMTETVVSVIVLAVVGLLFVAAKPVLQRLQTLLAIILLAGVAVIAVVCLPRAAMAGSLNDFGTGEVSHGYAVFSLIILAPWAFVGFETTAFDTAHFKFSSNKFGRLVTLAIIGTAFAYISMTLVSVAAVPDGYPSWQAYISSLDSLDGIVSVPTFYAAGSVMGRFGLILMTITALASILTGIIGGYRATTRVLATMAEDHILSERFRQTTFSILFIMIISIVIAMFGRNTLNWFVDLTSFGAIVGFGYTSAAARKTARSEGNRRVEITGTIGTVISVIFAIVQLVPRLSAMEAMGSEAFLLLSVWCLVGFIFYWRTVTKSTLTEYSGMSTSGIVLFSLLTYSALMWLAKRLAAGEMSPATRSTLVSGGILMMLIIFAGLAIMLYVQNIVRKKHESSEREKIHAVESSLAKSRFLFNMSHDIRTPMNAIIGYTNLALGEQTSDTVHEYLEKIGGSSKHMLDLINDILEMSRIETGKLELEYAPMDITALFDEMHELFTEQMRQKNIDFKVHTGQVQDHYVWCDRKNMTRVLLNILSNAYKFTPEGGAVSAVLTEAGKADQDHGLYEIRVRDNGIGMSAEFAEHIFTAFERERTSTVSGIDGTGLGMSITKGIVDQMGGTIEVLTAPGTGTEFIIRLKLQLADSTETETPDRPDTSADLVAFAGKRLLLVEDNAVNMEIAEMILSQAGFIVEKAENGQIAVDMVAGSDPGYYDGILMDIQMPVMDGYTATRTIRALDNESLAGIPIIAMTANAFKEDQEAAFEAGMQAHIAKPIDISVMMKTLTEVLR